MGSLLFPNQWREGPRHVVLAGNSCYAIVSMLIQLLVAIFLVESSEKIGVEFNCNSLKNIYMYMHINMFVYKLAWSLRSSNLMLNPSLASNTGLS